MYTSLVIFLKFGFKFWLLKITKSQLILALFGYISQLKKKGLLGMCTCTNVYHIQNSVQVVSQWHC